MNKRRVSVPPALQTRWAKLREPKALDASSSLRTFVEARNESDWEERQKLIARCFAPNAVLLEEDEKGQRESRARQELGRFSRLSGSAERRVDGDAGAAEVDEG